MARIGVFAAQMTPRTGGAFRLIDELMATAGRSEHSYLYVSHDPRPSPAPLPANVEWAGRSPATVRSVQALLNVPGVGRPLSRPAVARGLLGGVTRVRPSRFDDVDLWIWSHACMPVPDLGVPVAPIVHDMIHVEIPEAFSRRVLRMRASIDRRLDRCAAVLTPSTTTETDLLRRHPQLRGRTFVFPAAPSEVVDEPEATPQVAACRTRFGDRPLLLTVGVDWPHKNHEVVLDAAARLREHPRRPAFVFVGERRSGRLEGLLNDHHLESVVDLGRVDRPTLAALYAGADALLFPSRYEGFGIPLVEAMRYGTPVIASDRGAIPEVLDGAGELLDPDDAAGWAQAIDRLLSDDEYRSGLRRRARERAGDYTWDRTWAALDPILARLAA